MHSRTRKTTWLFLLFSLAVLLLNVRPAFADDGLYRLQNPDGADYGFAVVGSNDLQYGTRIFTASNSTTTIRAYCVENTVAVRRDHTLKLSEWGEFPGSNNFGADEQVRLKAAWIAANTYPQIDLELMREKTGVDGLSVKEAITASQAAIWHFTDGLQLADVSGASGGEKANVVAVYNYLTGDANVGANLGPSVQVTTPDVGTAGQRLGPIKVSANTQAVAIEGLDMPLVDAQGRSVDAKNAPTNVDLYVDIPDDAPAASQQFKVSAISDAYLGHLLVDTDAQNPTQTIIVSGSHKVSAEAEGKITWEALPPAPAEPEPSQTPEPVPTPSAPVTEAKAPGLPKTGEQGFAVLALAVLAAGGTWVSLRRR
ncbi:TQXA domain-containing protein [Propionimicrobium lymphophilum ACS-093-V-SCH5]|uniref:TQXA domain-containing protein n=1 Tax=Propionimicrobium lymphophilum ACS-093-V-SCH5 TaxID=883161 RepID=S2VZE7_9ACTN|nr:thioester domain-containing protein [Propionimicrobium lymphophilum]EPD32196.1 TQXA domain-containing protein [Propionimicrobium lymphophilum ACS-093-V-SCH5]